MRNSVPKSFLKHLEWQRTRKWHHWIEGRTKKDLLNYDGRYVGRPPIAESNIKEVTEEGVLFIAKVYPGDNTNPNGLPSAHKKVEKTVTLDLRGFIKRITNHLPEALSTLRPLFWTPRSTPEANCTNCHRIQYSGFGCSQGCESSNSRTMVSEGFQGKCDAPASQCFAPGI